MTEKQEVRNLEGDITKLSHDNKEVQTPIFYEIRTMAQHRKRPPYVCVRRSSGREKAQWKLILHFLPDSEFVQRPSID